MILPLSIPSPEMQNLPFWPRPIQIYALCLMAGMVVAWLWTRSRLSKRGADPSAALDFALLAIIFGIFGARIYHVLTHWGDYFGTGAGFWETVYGAVAFWNGGIAIFGALLGGAVGVLVASRLTGVRFWSFADALVPGLLIAQALGRFGNWFNHELYGGPTTLPWGLEIPLINPATGARNPAYPIGLPEGVLFHPTFLYEIVWNVIGVIVLLWIERRLRPRWGQFFGMYLIWYGIGRAWIEAMRVDPSLLFLGLRTNELTAIVAIVLGLLIILVQRRRHPGIEVSVYLPGRMRPYDTVLRDTADPEKFYHVIDRGDAETPAQRAGASDPQGADAAQGVAQPTS